MPDTALSYFPKSLDLNEAEAEMLLNDLKAGKKKLTDIPDLENDLYAAQKADLQKVLQENEDRSIFEKVWSGLKDAPEATYNFIKENPKTSAEIAGTIAMTPLTSKVPGGNTMMQKAVSSVIKAAGEAGGAMGGNIIGQKIEGTPDDQIDLKETATTGGISAVTDLGTQGVLGAVKKVLKPVDPNTMVEGGARAKKFIEGKGGRITPGRLMDDNFVAILEDVTERSLLGSSLYKRTASGAEEIAQDSLTNLAKQLKSQATKEDTGVLLSNLLADRKDTWSAVGRGLYKQLDNATYGIDVDIRDVKKAAQMIASEQIALEKPNKAVMEYLNEIIDLDADTLTFMEAQQLRSDLFGIVPSSNDPIPSKVQAIFSGMGRKVDEAMEAGAKSANNEEAYKLWQQANAHWKKGHEFFNSQFFKAYARQAPDVVYDNYIKKGRSYIIRGLRDVVLDGSEEGAKTWAAVQGQFIDDIWRKSIDENMKNLSGKTFLRELKNFDGTNKTLDVLFPNGGAENLRELARTLQITQGKANPTSDIGVAFALMQGGSLGALAADPQAETEVGQTAYKILLTPIALATLLTSKTGTKWLTEGLTLKRGTEGSVRAITQMSALLANEGLIRDVQTKDTID